MTKGRLEGIKEQHLSRPSQYGYESRYEYIVIGIGCLLRLRNGDRDASDTLQREVMLALGTMHIVAGKWNTWSNEYGDGCYSMYKVVDPFIPAYIRDKGHHQQFSDGNFTLANPERQ